MLEQSPTYAPTAGTRMDIQRMDIPVRGAVRVLAEADEPSDRPVCRFGHDGDARRGHLLCEPGRDRVVIERSEDLVVDHARIGVAPGGDEHLGQPVGVGRGARPQYSAYGLSRPAPEVHAEAEAVAPVERLDVLDRAQ